MKKSAKLLWFLVGLGSELQIVASLSFTELFALVMAPFLFVKYRFGMKRDGVMPLFVLALCVFFGCVVACFVNQTGFNYALRGYAVTSIIPCSIVVSYWLIRRDANGFKWYLLGAACSWILCTFVFQKAVELSDAGGVSGSQAVESIMNGPIYVIGRMQGFVKLFTQGWYLHSPIWIDIPAVLFFALFSILTTVSGRSASLSAFAFVAILLVGGKSIRTMRTRLCKHIWLWATCAVLGVFAAKFAYETAATQGWLGEEAYQKYEKQTQGNKSMMALLLGGRMESFCGLIACIDKPLVGFGPWAMDRDGYTEQFLLKYGKQEDVDSLYRAQENGELGLIPCHAYITEFWLWYGIFGLIFWLYILFVFVRYLRYDCWAVPQWFAWLACAIPGYCWNVFFSALGNRFPPFLFVVGCLMARAARRGTFRLPQEMVDELVGNERKRR